MPGIQCQLCRMTFYDQSAINAHYDSAHSQTTDRARRTGEGTYECDVCGRKLSRKVDLRRHMATVHAVGDVKKFQCDICSREFTLKFNLKTHMKNVHQM